MSERDTMPPPDLVEQACPNCGEPMLAAWGATCGRCKPGLSYSKTVILASVDVAGMLPLALGWLVVLRSPKPALRGTLFDLSQPATILTRSDAAAVDGARVISLDDGFMSASHATIRRPARVTSDAGFTIEDRKAPGPSANGTFVNSRKLAPGETARLGDGDLIRLGATELKFKSLFLPAAMPPT
jgi:FHA domain